MLAISGPFELQLVLIKEDSYESAAEGAGLFFLPTGKELTVSLVLEHEPQPGERGHEYEFDLLRWTNAKIAFLLLLLQ